MKKNNLIKLDEPLLLFGHNQALEDPRDGLTLFGPLKSRPPYGISYGIVGTKKGIERFYKWANQIHNFLAHTDIAKRELWIPFPGFEATFGVPFSEKAVIENVISDKRLADIFQEGDNFQIVYKTVTLYAQPILNFYREADEHIDVWLIISPEEVFDNCRPKSRIECAKITVTGREIKARKQTAEEIKRGQQFFLDSLEDYEAYQFDNDFRKQLKARLILGKIKNPIQIVRESTLTPNDFLNKKGERKRDLQPESQVAWNLLSSVFYKAGGKPWKLRGIREGVCYLGMVYKRLEREHDPRSACCAAQMFLDSGDGVVFKGAVGPWKSPVGEHYHLNEEAAKEIIERALYSYASYFGGSEEPKEIFIHGRTYFNEEEWKGFTSVVSSKTNVVGVRIRHSPLRLFRQGDYFLLRGMAYIEHERLGHLWTTGYIPRLQTSPFQGVPIPLDIEICRGEADISTVLQDIYALTKLNYNSCHYGDSKPITLSFADNIGEILTAGPIEKDVAPLPFKFYV